MEKTEFRALIKYFYLQKKTATEICRLLREASNGSTPSFKTVCFWVNEFKRGRTSTCDGRRSGRPVEVTTAETIARVYDIILKDDSVKLQEIADEINISKERVGNIVHEHLHMTKITTRWMAKQLSDKQREERINSSKQCLEIFKRDPRDFLHRFLTVGEIWIDRYSPGAGESVSTCAIQTGERSAKIAKLHSTAIDKCYATIFWDANGIILIECCEKSEINDLYNSAILERLKNELTKEKPRLSFGEVLFLATEEEKDKLGEVEFSLLPQALHSPDLSPSDYYLFPNLKKWLFGKRLISQSQIITALHSYFEELNKTYFVKGIKELEIRWTKCVELHGDYLAK